MSVVSIIVTYNPDSDFRSKLQNIVNQSEYTIIIDNCSKKNVKLHTAGMDNVVIVQNSENVGIAAALNQGIAFAQAYGAEYVCMFDQDSEITPNFIQNLISGFEVIPNVGIVAANYTNPVSGRLGYEDGISVIESYFRIDHAITSGSMITMSIFSEVGLMRDELFIDYVDIEFCERLKGKYIILATAQSIMMHPIGQAENHHFLGRKIAASNHSPLRRYYMARNCVHLIRENIRLNPNFAYISLKRLIKIIIMVSAFEEYKLKKIGAISYGMLDAIMGRMGKCTRKF